MYNKDGEIIYLGQSSDIQQRVNKHFIKDGKKSRNLQKETKKVTFELTGNELIARLKENEELQRNRPRYNHWQDRFELQYKPSSNGHEKLFQSLLDKNILIVDKGRETGEKSAVWIKNGELIGLGYFNLNHQINNIHILESLITPMTNDSYAQRIIENYLENSRTYKIIELNEEH